MGKVRAVCISEKRGTQKKNIESAVFVENWALREMPMQETGTGRFPYYQRKRSPHLRRVVQRLQMGLSEKISS